MAARILLGAIFFVMGLNFLFHFLPMPQPTPAGMSFLGSLMATGYMFPTIKTVEILCGLALMAGYFVPLALILLSPIIINIFLYHLFLDPGGLLLALVLVALALFLGHS